MNAPLPVSIFNDVIGPVMRGPSSSHCAAALRIGRLARDLMEGDIDEVVVAFDRLGSLPTTHESQGSDMGLFGGLLGWDAADARLPDSSRHLASAGIRVRFETVDVNDPHPNTYRLHLRNAQGHHDLIAISTGGGMMEIIALDGAPVRWLGDAHVTLIWTLGDIAALRESIADCAGVRQVDVHDTPGGRWIEVQGDALLPDSTIAEGRSRAGIQRVRRLGPVLPVTTPARMAIPFASCADMLRYDQGRMTPLWKLAIEYECARGGLSEPAVLDMMRTLVRILRASIQQGVAGTHYADRILGPQSPRFNECLEARRLLAIGSLNRILLYVSALMEVKSSMGVIVAAPTAGACAAMPAAVIGMAEDMNLSEDDMARAMLASGLIGVFIATPWTFAAEVGGCQAEGGSAAAMAAAALVTLADGSLTQAIAAASMALQGMLGLICDPVASRVEVPCLGKNVLAASQAVACANLALADFDPVIPFDEVVQAARTVAGQMPRELRCTALGGLAITPTAQAIERRLAQRSSSRCDPAGCGCPR